MESQRKHIRTTCSEYSRNFVNIAISASIEGASSSKNVEFLGLSVSLEGVEMSYQYIEAVRDCPRHLDIKAVERF